jgi:hypothetical protein
VRRHAIPPWIDAMLMRLADTIPALAMLSVGYQLRFAALAATAARSPSGSASSSCWCRS